MANLSSKAMEQRRTLRVHLFGAVEQERAKVRTVLAKITDPALEIVETDPFGE